MRNRGRPQVSAAELEYQASLLSRRRNFLLNSVALRVCEVENEKYVFLYIPR